MRGIVLSCLAAATLLALPPAAARDGVEPARILKDEGYLTIGDRTLRLDAYLHPDAARQPGPVLIHFHGGGWARGARPESWSGFRAYLDAGFSVVTAEYRLAGDARAPAAVQDARCVLSWVGENAERLGIDPRRIVVSGTSAGAHLALMAGLLPPANGIDLPECADAPRAAAIVDFYGPVDLTLESPKGGRHPTVANWIGARTGSEAMIHRLSPVTWLSAHSPPIFIVHGDADPVVPVAQSIDLKRRLDELRVPAELVVVPGGGHGRFDPAERAAMMDRLMVFLCARQLPAAEACAEKK